MTKVGFIGGGQMATALAKGTLDAGKIQGLDLVFAEPVASQQQKLREQFPDANIVSEASELLGLTSHAVLAVKPHIVKAIAPQLKPLVTSDHLLISIAGGITLSTLQELFDTKRVIRVMPNTPAQVGCGASAMSADEQISEEDLAWVRGLMEAVGDLVQIPDELMHAFVGIAGSSPAYIYLVIEALSDGGVAQGLSRPLATKMAAQAVLGAAKMVLETGLHPGVLKDQVTSPGGTTIAALRTLEQAGVRSGFMEAVATCTARSKELE